MAKEWSTAVEINARGFILRADILWPTQECARFRLMIGGAILSTFYESPVDAIDAAEAILWRLAEGDALLEPMPDEESEYTGETLPTGWDAADHKALYE